MDCTTVIQTYWMSHPNGQDIMDKRTIPLP
jgi:hypothetical protein